MDQPLVLLVAVPMRAAVLALQIPDTHAGALLGISLDRSESNLMFG